MTPEIILWIYIALLIAGGLMGFIKGKSKASIIASTLFAIPLALSALHIISPPWIADVILGVLVVFFGMRFAKSKKFMPAGLMTILSLAAIIGRVVIE
ncbi:MAG: TMEM14 family protein [Verrucomicrobia bacterium]|nr:TMEM14 family protein [Verrucomicrobiota bacterium]